MLENEAAEIITAFGLRAKGASKLIANASSSQKNKVLLTLADLLREKSAEIYQANRHDVELGIQSGLSEAFIDRLTITEKILNQMIKGLHQISELPDPIGQISNVNPQPSGIEVGKMRVPLGVIGIIYESRPNVTIDAAALCIKTGNATILRGGKETVHSNTILSVLISEALLKNGLPADSVQVITNPDRALVRSLITAKGLVDAIIPRGGKGLISLLMSEATVPMIKHLEGICHTYVDQSADEKLAIEVCDNAKTQRYSPCNAMETLLVHQSLASSFLPKMAAIFLKKGVELRCDERSYTALTQAGLQTLKHASLEDWSTEYNAPILSIKVVNNLDEAIDHINKYGSHHTDAILTNDLVNAQQFLRRVDSSSVMVNTSTRFADGFEYGLGAEIGISTDKFHARGPVGLEGLTSQKFVVFGHGELRQ